MARKKPSEHAANLVVDGVEVASVTPITTDRGGKPEQVADAEAERLAAFRSKFLQGDAILEMEPTAFILKNRLVARGITVLYSAPKVGKSFVAIEMSLQACLGEYFFEERFPAGMTVLYIAAERPSVVRDRLEAAALAKGLDGIPKNLHLWKGPGAPQLTSATDMALLREVVAELKPSIIVLDTWAKMTLGVAENDAAEAGPVMERIAELTEAAGVPCAAFVVHHAGKDPTKGMRGSTAILGAADAVWKLSGDAVALKLEVEDINAAQTPLPAWYAIEEHHLPPLEGETEKRSVGVLVETKAREVGTKLDAKIRAIFESTGMEHSAQQLTDALNAEGEASARPTVNKAIKRMVDLGELVPLGQGRTTRYRMVGGSSILDLDTGGDN